MKIASTLVLVVAFLGQSCMTQKDKEIYADLFLNKTDKTSQTIEPKNNTTAVKKQTQPQLQQPKPLKPITIMDSEVTPEPWDDSKLWQK